MRIVLVALIWIGGQVLPACADNLVWRKGGGMDIFPAAPASELLSAEALKKYRKYLADDNCHDALILLNEAFVARYPQFPNAAHGVPRDSITTHEDFRDWVTFLVPSKYRALHYCRMKKIYLTVEREINARGLTIGLVYPGKYIIGEDKKPDGYDSKSIRGGRGMSLWRERDLAILLMTTLAAREHVRAVLFLAKLVRRGGIFRKGADPEMEYFLFRRACHLGHKCASFKHRIDELEKEISTDRVAELKANSKQKKTANDLIYRYVYKRKNL